MRYTVKQTVAGHAVYCDECLVYEFSAQRHPGRTQFFAAEYVAWSNNQHQFFSALEMIS